MAFTFEVNESQAFPPLPTLTELIQKETKKVDFVTSVTILSGFDYTINGTVYHFSFGVEDQSNFIQESVRAAAAAATPEGKSAYRAYWRGHKADGTTDTLEFTYEEFMALLMYCGTNKSNILASGWTKKGQLEACKTKLELEELVKSLDLDVQVRDARDVYEKLIGASEFAGI